MIFIIDTASMLTAMVAAWLWYAASRSNVRRVSSKEDLDYHDFNRLIVSFNRNQLLNSRAALASALSALLVAARFAVSIATS